MSKPHRGVRLRRVHREGWPVGGRLSSLGKPGEPGRASRRGVGGRRLQVRGPRRAGCHVGAVDAMDGRIHLTDHTGERDDVEDALTSSEQIDDLFARAQEHRSLADEDEVCSREVLSDRVTETFDRPPRLAQVDASVEELLDHLQLEQILVGIEALRSAATRLGERRPAAGQSGPSSPVAGR